MTTEPQTQHENPLQWVRDEIERIFRKARAGEEGVHPDLHALMTKLDEEHGTQPVPYTDNEPKPEQAVAPDVAQSGTVDAAQANAPAPAAQQTT